jgi:hypothetical protein
MEGEGREPIDTEMDRDHALLLAAVHRADAKAVAHLARQCRARGTLDSRDPNGCMQRAKGHGHSLTAAPHLHAVYTSAGDVLEELLVSSSTVPIDERSKGWCSSGACCGGMTALHWACALRSVGCVRALLLAGACAELEYCQPIADVEDGAGADISFLSAIQLAKHSGGDGASVMIRELLIEHGASESNHPDSECPVCYEALEGGQTIEVTDCGHRFHRCCLPPVVVSACPLCRAPLDTRCRGVDSAQNHGGSPAGGAPTEGGISPVAAPTLLDRALRASSSPGSVACWLANHRGGRAQQQPMMDDRYRRAEPPYIQSGAWAQSTAREYTEVERRRM